MVIEDQPHQIVGCQGIHSLQRCRSMQEDLPPEVLIVRHFARIALEQPRVSLESRGITIEERINEQVRDRRREGGVELESPMETFVGNNTEVLANESAV